MNEYDEARTLADIRREDREFRQDRKEQMSDKATCPICSGPTKRIVIPGYSQAWLCEACDKAFSIADTTVSENVTWSTEIRSKDELDN